MIALLALSAVACSGGGSGGNTAGADPTRGCDGRCAESGAFLSADEVGRILSQGAQEATARGERATIAVVDRVGNVLGVYRMGAKNRRHTLIASAFTAPDPVVDATNDETFAISGGLESIKLPEANARGTGALADANLDQLAAISKAITGAYLSTEGMALTSRTASQIVQDHFNPGEDFQPGGPLFGVQFSQLACSDFTLSSDQGAAGPQRSPLGLSADPGGLPLYENGSLVGGVGVMADGVYGLDPFVGDTDADRDEVIAVAAAFGFEAPLDRRATVTVEGKVLRYTDVDVGSLVTNPATAPPFSTIAQSDTGRLIAVRGYSDAALRDGTRFGFPESGVAADAGGAFPAGSDAHVFVDAAGTPRYPPTAAADAAFAGDRPLSADEVREILASALDIAGRARAQIRRPLGTPARVTISVVDTRGNVLGMVRSRDAPVFGADVSLQKARTAAFLSSSDAADFFLNPTLTEGDTFVEQTRDGGNVYPLTTYVQRGNIPGVPALPTVDLRRYVADFRMFVGLPNALADGRIAFTDRAGGNLSRPFYPDGINGNPPGPFSKPPGEWSVFSTGLQYDLVNNAILRHVLFAANGNEDGTVSEQARLAFPPVPEAGCAGKGLSLLGRPAVREVTGSRLANGLQIFPGSVPIYRDRQLVGAIGVSGDGVDQDDLIAFGGVGEAGRRLGTFGNAPPDMRADLLQPQGIRLRYVQCPQAPLSGSTVDNVCEGL